MGGTSVNGHRQTDNTQQPDEREQHPETPALGSRNPLRITLLRSAAAALLLLVASPLARHWLPVVFANVCILGGIVAAPIVSVVAWIGLILPTHALLHQIAPALVATSLVWFGMAIVGAHAMRLDPRNRK